MRHIRKFFRAFVPEEVFGWYHWAQSMAGAVRYGFPSRRMIVIGVTGSKGKTTTANLIWAALSASGTKVGATGTANLRIGNHEMPNKSHMTMLGRWYLQRFLAQMARADCKYAVVEVPSEGQKHYRQAGINFDVLVFTNLTHELLAIHGNSFEQLKRDNGRVFRHLAHQQHKRFDWYRDGQTVPKTIIVNTDADDASEYARAQADSHASFSVRKSSDFQARDIRSDRRGNDFQIGQQAYHLPIVGEFNVINAVGAVAVASQLGVESAAIARGLADLRVIPGRMEVIDEGQDFTVIVDYAHEQAGLQLLMDSARKIIDRTGKIIVHLGAEGGGRDVAKRPEMGEIAARGSDFVIVGNVDPYDDPPAEIIEDIARGAERAGKVRDRDLFCIEDRRAGIARALALAHSGDLVLITSKGAEQSIIIDGVRSKWDDRDVVREELRKLLKD